MENQVVNMDHFNVDAQLEELAKRRYAMPPAAIAALRQAGQAAAGRLLKMVTDEKTFTSLAPKDQLALLNLVLDRAYGRAETASSNDLANQRMNGKEGNEADHAKQLEAIEAREKAAARGRKGLPSPKDLLARMDRENNFSVADPYSAAEEGEADLSPASPSPTRSERRNRPVPPSENVVALRRSGE